MSLSSKSLIVHVSIAHARIDPVVQRAGRCGICAIDIEHALNSQCEFGAPKPEQGYFDFPNALEALIAGRRRAVSTADASQQKPRAVMAEENKTAAQPLPDILTQLAVTKASKRAGTRQSGIIVQIGRDPPFYTVAWIALALRCSGVEA
jgi:hypothetical protein